MANDHLDYLVRPVEPPMRTPHRLIGEFLYEWSRGRSQSALEITLVAEQWSPRAHEIRELLAGPAFRTASSAVMARTAAGFSTRSASRTPSRR